MQFSSIVLALAGASTAFAAALPLEARQLPICSGLGSNLQCCATNVLDLADLNCANREFKLGQSEMTVGLTCASAPTTPTDVNNFIDICSAIGQQAQCCTLPIVSIHLAFETNDVLTFPPARPGSSLRRCSANRCHCIDSSTKRA
jgi:hypothetical protein